MKFISLIKVKWYWLIDSVMRRVFSCALVFMLLLPVVCVSGIEESTALSFFEEFELVEQTFSLGNEDVSISLMVDSSLSFSENMIVKASSSVDYVEDGKTCDIIARPRNAVTILKLTGDVSGSFSYVVGIVKNSIDISVKHFQITQTITEFIGEPTSIKLDDKLVYTGTIPLLGVQITIFVRPVLEYTPTIDGDLFVEGPAQITSEMSWRNGGLLSSVEFIDTQPVSFTLNEPRFRLTDFNVSLDVFATIGLVTVTAPRQELLNLGTTELSAEATELVSLEPNYYELYTELLEFNYPPVEELNHIENSISDLSKDLVNIKEEINILQGGYNSLLDADRDILSEIQSLRTILEDIEYSLNELRISYESSKIDTDARLSLLSDERSQLGLELNILWILTIGSLVIFLVCIYLIVKNKGNVSLV